MAVLPGMRGSNGVLLEKTKKKAATAIIEVARHSLEPRCIKWLFDVRVRYACAE